MELTNEDKQVIVNLLSQVSVPVSQAQIVLKIIDKLNIQLQTGQLPAAPVTSSEEVKKEG